VSAGNVYEPEPELILLYRRGTESPMGARLLKRLGALIQLFARDRAITIRWIWLVPSKICMISWRSRRRPGQGRRDALRPARQAWRLVVVGWRWAPSHGLEAA
jgi:hypothetical protein